MKIACLAWGSLIWKSAPLELVSGWHGDGPHLPIELVRVGDGGELATTLWAGAATQRSRWALLKQTDLALAREMLRQREKIDTDRPEWIGSYPSHAVYPWNSVIERWLETKDLDAVIWTALPPRFDGLEGQAPDIDEAISYLQQLQGDRRRHAESYIRRIPPGLSTRYRRAIESALGWLPSTAQMQVTGRSPLGDSVVQGDDTDDNNLELAADNLRARAVEQAGGYSHETICNWMARHELTLDAAADALGLSRRMLAYYRSGSKPVPRTVALACLGWEAEQQLPRHDERSALAA